MYLVATRRFKQFQRLWSMACAVDRRLLLLNGKTIKASTSGSMRQDIPGSNLASRAYGYNSCIVYLPSPNTWCGPTTLCILRVRHDMHLFSLRLKALTVEPPPIPIPHLNHTTDRCFESSRISLLHLSPRLHFPIICLTF